MNALTFRDKDLVVFLGDSITEDNAYAGILADWYLTRFPERDVRFVNSGVPGDQAWRAARPDEMEDRVFSLNPSAVLVMFGMNDCANSDFGPAPTEVQIAARAGHLATFRAASIAKWPSLREKAAPIPHRYELWKRRDFVFKSFAFCRRDDDRLVCVVAR